MAVKQFKSAGEFSQTAKAVEEKHNEEQARMIVIIRFWKTISRDVTRGK